MTKSDPFRRQTCGRMGCPFTTTTQACRTRCYTLALNYQYNCTRFEGVLQQEEPPEEPLELPQYRGESSRTAFSRHRGHMDMYKLGQSGFMWEHSAQSHGGVRGPEGGREDYRMSVVAVDRQPLRRILRKAIRIRRA